jgi:hypothetical protein
VEGSKSEGHSHVGEEPRASSAGPIIAEPYQAARVHPNTHMLRRAVTRSTEQPGVVQNKETLVLQLIGGRHIETARINQASLRAWITVAWITVTCTKLHEFHRNRDGGPLTKPNDGKIGGIRCTPKWRAAADEDGLYRFALDL